MRSSSVNVVALIDDELHTNGFPPNFGRAALQAGGLLVLLDGLDEVPSHKLDDAIKSIRDLVDHYPLCRFVTSCRTAFYKDYFTRFSDVLLTDFTDDQIQNMIQNWFRSDRDRELETAKTLWDLLTDPKHQATRELARTPLLATFLCLVYDDRQTLPTNRAELYGDALRILLERWAASKRVHSDLVFPGLSVKRELLMLEQFAGPAYEHQHYFFSALELATAFEEFLRSDANGSDQVDGRKILEEIEGRQGLLVKRAHDKYSFSHLTLHEYLAACHYHKTGRDQQIIAQTLTDGRWREIHLLLAGLQEPSADRFLLSMVNATAGLLNTPPLRELVSWARRMVERGKSPQRTSAWHAVLLSYALALDPDDGLNFGIDVAHDFAQALAQALDLALTLDRDLARALDLEVTLDLDLTRPFHLSRSRAHMFDGFFKNHDLIPTRLLPRFDEVHKTFVRNMVGRNFSLSEWSPHRQHFCQQFQDALEIPATARGLSQENVRQFGDFLTCTRRILDCRDAAERVTQVGWDRVCKRLFALPK